MGKLANALNMLKTNLLGGSPTGSIGYGTGKGPQLGRVSPVELTMENPLDKMDYDPFAWSSIAYPRELSDNQQMGHYILFYINVQDLTTFKYEGYKDGKPVSIGKEFKMKEVWTGTDEDLGFNAEGEFVKSHEEYTVDGGVSKPSYTEGRVLREGGTILDSDSINLTRVGRKAKVGMAAYRDTRDNPYGTSRIKHSVALYLPPNVTDNYAVGYNNTNTGMLGFMAATIGGGIGAWKDKDLNKLADTIGDGLFGFADYAFKKGVLSSAEFLSSAEGGEELWNKAFGAAANPYLEVLFDAPQLREFTYNFTFAPRNVDETKDVQTIIQIFRYHMAPELRSDNNRFLTLPSTFDIHYMYQGSDGSNQENDFYNRIATCVLKNCAVDYTPGSVRSHADGSPVQIKMALTFQETEMLTKQHIDDGY
tara:strand:- start:311 stop:1573 length:1263 start_codon:yes stop_codon:yes gene_type:complete